MITVPQTARADVVTGTKTSIGASSNQLTTTSVRLTQGVWIFPSSESVSWIGIDSAAAGTGVRIQLDADAHAESAFIPINDPSRVYIHTVGGSGVVGFMYC